MKVGKPLDFIRTFATAGAAGNFRNISGKPLGFVLLAFVIGATVSQGSFAFADDSATNPFRAIWDAIGELQVKTDTLQAQIDDLKAQQGTTATAAQIVTRTSDGSVAIEVGGGQSDQTLVTLIVRNSGPNSAVGAKLTAFYQPSLLQVNFIQGAECSDGSRGIIECYLGTLAAGSEAIVTIDATPISLGQQAIITTDFSSITRDANPADNHAEAVFVTAIVPVAQPAPAPTTSSGGGSAQVEQSAAEEQGEEQTAEGAQETEQSEQTDQGASEQTEDSGETIGDQGESAGDTETGESGGETGVEGSDSGSTGDTGESGSEGSSDGGSSEDGSGSSDGGDSEDTGSDGGSSGGDSGSTG